MRTFFGVGHECALGCSLMRTRLRILAQKWVQKAYTTVILSIAIYISGLGDFYVTLLLT